MCVCVLDKCLMNAHTHTPLLIRTKGRPSVNLANKFIENEVNVKGNEPSAKNKWRHNHFENALIAVKLSININLHLGEGNRQFCMCLRIPGCVAHSMRPLKSASNSNIWPTAWFDEMGDETIVGETKREEDIKI